MTMWDFLDKHSSGAVEVAIVAFILFVLWVGSS
jgi:hypothetical protein